MSRRVVCNTSPIQYLFQLGHLDLLAALTSEVLIPEAVVKELAVGRSLGASLPDVTLIPWMHITTPESAKVLPLVTDLGAGEKEVLAIALESPDLVAVLDDGLARRFAKNLNILFTGTLGLLIDAKRQGLITRIEPLLDELDRLGFRVSKHTRTLVLERANEAGQ